MNVTTILKMIEGLKPFIELIKNLIKKGDGDVPPGKPGHWDLPDEDIPDPTSHDRKPSQVKIQVMRIVLSAKRFPQLAATGQLMLEDPGSYEGGAKAIPFNSKVTFDTELLDSQGGIPVQEGSPLSHTTVFRCKDTKTGETAQVGPGSGEKLTLIDTSTVGAGGKNYDESSHGMIATFRLAAESTYEIWAFNDVESRKITLRTS